MFIAYFVVSFIIFLPFLLEEERSVITILTFTGIFFAIQILSFMLSTRTLKRNSKTFNTRRLLGTYLFSDIVIVIPLCLIIFFNHSVEKQVESLLLLTFLAITINLFVIWPVFSTRLSYSLFTSVLGILPTTALVLTLRSPSSFTWLSIPLGVILILSMYLTLIKVQHSGLKRFNTPTFDILKAFLVSWTDGNPSDLENILLNTATDNTIDTKVITIENSKKLAIIIPNVHPGPFYPVGSYNLTERLHNAFLKKGYDHCFVLHGIVDHTYNIASTSDVDTYLSQLAENDNFVPMQNITTPITLTKNNVTVTSISLGNVPLIIISSWPFGGEDYPPKFTRSADIIMRKDSQLFAIVDAHNSIGKDPDDEKQSTLLELITECLSKGKDAQSHTPYCAFTTYYPRHTDPLSSDIGNGGIGLLLLQLGNEKYALISIDANNAVNEVRQAIESKLESLNIKLLELCTSDTHFNAARIRNGKGYLLLGEITKPETIADIIHKMATTLIQALEPSKIKFSNVKNTVKTLNEDVFKKFQILIRESLQLLKAESVILAGITFLGLFFISYFH
ncbi:MAG: DUF2070 family protein [Nitrososphaerota archaeon]